MENILYSEKIKTKRIQNRSLVVIAVLLSPFISTILSVYFRSTIILMFGAAIVIAFVVVIMSPKLLYWAIFWKYDFIPKRGYPLLIELEPDISPENYYKVYSREIVKEILENGYDRDVILVGRKGERADLAKEYKIVGYDGLREYGDMVKMSEDEKQLRSLRLNKVKTTLRTR